MKNNVKGKCLNIFYNKNFKFHWKDALVLGVSVIVCVLVSVLFLNFSSDLKSNFNLQQTNIDYIIQTPSASQVNSLKEHDNILSVTPYLYTSAELISGNKVVKTDLIIVLSKEDVQKTEFSNNLLIKESKKDYENELFIDSNYAKLNNLKIDEKITLKISGSNAEYFVKAIYETDGKHKAGMAVAICNNATKQIIDSIYGLDYKFSGAYIDSANTNLTNAIIDSYIPEGDLLTREDFANEELYQAYLDLRADTNFKLTTFYTDNYLNQVHLKYDNQILIYTILSYSMLLLEFVVIGVYLFVKVFKYSKTEIIKDVKNNFTKKQEQVMFNKYFLITTIVILSLSVILALINFLIFKISFINLFSLLILTLPIVSIGIVWLVQILILKRNFRKIEK